MKAASNAMSWHVQLASSHRLDLLGYLTCCRSLYHATTMVDRRRQQIVLAYRHLYQLALRAVHYSKPARFTIRDRLRRAFRDAHPNDFDGRRVRNTCQFLHTAASARTLEHSVLRSLLITWYWEPPPHSKSNYSKRTPQRELAVKQVSRDQFNHTLRMLNESMGMCLR